MMKGVKPYIFSILLGIFMGPYGGFFVLGSDFHSGGFSTPDPYLIQTNRVGKLVLGTYLKEIFWNYSNNRIGKVFIHDGRGMYSQYEILSPDEKEVLFSVEPDCRQGDSLCIIKKIEIYNPLFHTPRNIRVGMMFQDLLLSGSHMEYLGWDRGSLIARAVGEPYNYILSTSGIPKTWFSKMESQSLPISTKIIGIVLTGSEKEGFTFRQFDSVLLGKKFFTNRIISKPRNAPITALTTLKEIKKETPYKASETAPKNAPYPAAKFIPNTLASSIPKKVEIAHDSISKTITLVPSLKKEGNKTPTIKELSPPEPSKSAQQVKPDFRMPKPPIFYIIATPGESIYTVSRRFNLSVSEIFDYNPFLSLRKIMPGDKIYLVNKDSIPGSSLQDIDPYHSKGSVSKVYLQTKDYTYGSSSNSSNLADTMSFKRNNSPMVIKNK